MYLDLHLHLYPASARFMWLLLLSSRRDVEIRSGKYCRLVHGQTGFIPRPSRCEAPLSVAQPSVGARCLRRPTPQALPPPGPPPARAPPAGRPASCAQASGTRRGAARSLQNTWAIPFASPSPPLRAPDSACHGDSTPSPVRALPAGTETPTSTPSGCHRSLHADPAPAARPRQLLLQEPRADASPQPELVLQCSFLLHEDRQFSKNKYLKLKSNITLNKRTLVDCHEK